MMGTALRRLLRPLRLLPWTVRTDD